MVRSRDELHGGLRPARGDAVHAKAGVEDVWYRPCTSNVCASMSPSAPIHAKAEDSGLTSRSKRLRGLRQDRRLYKA